MCTKEMGRPRPTVGESKGQADIRKGSMKNVVLDLGLTSLRMDL